MVAILVSSDLTDQSPGGSWCVLAGWRINVLAVLAKVRGTVPVFVTTTSLLTLGNG